MAADNKKLEGEVAIITGVSRGIDKAPKESKLKLEHVK